MNEVIAFLQSIKDPDRKEDCLVLYRIMQNITGDEPRLWNKTMVGFGTYVYHDKSDKEGKWFKIGFANRKQSLTIYMISGFEQFEHLLRQLGKHSLGSSCLYISGLKGVNLDILKEMLEISFNLQKSK